MVSQKQLERLIRVKANLETERDIFISRWKEIAAQMSGSYGSWGKQDNANGQKKLDSTKEIYDNTGNEASNLMADGLMGSSFGRNLDWFNFMFEKRELNDVDSASKWLKDQEKHCYAQFNKSNFYDEARIFTRHGGDFATAVMFMQEEPEEGRPFFKTQHPKDVCLMENRFGIVDTFFRDIYLTKDDAIAEFGKDKLPVQIAADENEDYTTKYVFHQYIGPNKRFQLDVAGTDEYISVYWSDYDTTKAIKEERYKRKPFVAWRWNRDLEGYVYGTQSPGMMQLSNMRTANTLSKNVLQLSQMVAQPMFKKTEGLIINIRPHGQTNLKQGEDFAPVPATGDLSFTEKERENYRQKIRSAYYSDFFLVLSQNLDKTKTATEVAGLMNEQSNIMSSFYNRLATEFLEPVIEFVFENELEHGRLDDLPEGMNGNEDIGIDFVSPLFLIQKRSHTVDALMQATTQIASLAEIFPTVVDKVDSDSLVDEIADGWNVRKQLILDDSEVQKIRDARAQQQQALMQQAMANEQAKTGSQMYRDMSKAPEQGSAMAALSGDQQKESA